MNLRIRPAARNDLRRQYRYYLQHATRQVADKYIAAAEQGMKYISEWTLTGSLVDPVDPAMENIRSWPLNDFRELRIYYLVHTGRVEVLRMLHSKRDRIALLKRSR